MADSFVQVPADDVGKKIETHDLVDGFGNTVQRQVVEVAEVVAMPTVTIQDGGGAITVDGSVAVSSIPTVTVQDGGGSLTVDGTVTANTGLTQPLTNTQLRAADVGAAIDDLAAAIYQLMGGINRPVYVNHLTGRMNATVDTVTTLSTVSNITQLSGIDASVLFYTEMRNKFNSGVGARIA